MTYFDRFVRRGGIILAMMLTVTSVRAQSVQPMRFDVAPTGSAAQTTMQVENNRSHPITVEIVAESITLDERGAEVLAPAEDDFLIFPPQAIIQPGVTQSVRVRYIGEPDIDLSRSYRVTVKQIPVDLSGQQRSGVALAFNFATLAGVVPAGAKPSLTVSSAGTDERGRAVVAVRNDGKAYARVLAYDWRLQSGGRDHVLTSNEVSAMIDGVSGLVPPGGERRLAIALPEGFDPAELTVSLTPR